jgi:hypothetical protein
VVGAASSSSGCASYSPGASSGHQQIDRELRPGAGVGAVEEAPELHGGRRGAAEVEGGESEHRAAAGDVLLVGEAVGVVAGEEAAGPAEAGAGLRQRLAVVSCARAGSPRTHAPEFASPSDPSRGRHH